jgi:hypothetical protein
MRVLEVEMITLPNPTWLVIPFSIDNVVITSCNAENIFLFIKLLNLDVLVFNRVSPDL